MLLVSGFVHDTCRKRAGCTWPDQFPSLGAQDATAPSQGSWQVSPSSQKTLNLFFCVAWYVIRALMFRVMFVKVSGSVDRSGW